MLVKLVFGDHGETFAVRLVVLLFDPGMPFFNRVVLARSSRSRRGWDEGIAIRLRLLEIVLFWLSLLPVGRLAWLGSS